MPFVDPRARVRRETRNEEMGTSARSEDRGGDREPREPVEGARKKPGYGSTKGRKLVSSVPCTQVNESLGGVASV
jgi:hypothetical protein